MSPWLFPFSDEVAKMYSKCGVILLLSVLQTTPQKNFIISFLQYNWKYNTKHEDNSAHSKYSGTRLIRTPRGHAKVSVLSGLILKKMYELFRVGTNETVRKTLEPAHLNFSAP